MSTVGERVAAALCAAGMTLDDLAAAAVSAAAASHSPYSGFCVGAVVLGADGTTTAGTNVESASYGLTCCAERTALFSHRATHPDVAPVAVAVACPGGDPEADPRSVMPCGACRQVIIELCGDDGIVVVAGVGHFRADELLPHAFRL